MENKRRDFLRMASMGLIGASMPKHTNLFF